ncbi:MAG: PAS domain-containing sensor histidine kinase [Azonexus sp.]|nr:PAS domain-containing sensor histidine kinase [Azonexus sp.]
MAVILARECVAGFCRADYKNKQIRQSPTIEGAYEAEDFFPTLSDGKWLQFTAAPLFDPNGKVIGAIENLQDVTRQRNIEIALRRSHEDLESQVAARTRELAEKNAALAQALDRQTELDRAKAQFLAAVSDELKSPLDCILGLSDLIRMRNADPEITHDAVEIQDNANQLRVLLSDLVAMSEITAGRAQLVASPCNPIETTQMIVSGYRQRLGGDSERIRLQVAPGCPEMWFGDARRFLRNIEALLENALHVSGTSPVDILLSRKSESLQVRVVDAAPVMDETAREHAFEHFSRSDRHQADAMAGNGIRLALARAQALMMGGSLIVEPGPEAGNAFVFTVPVRAPY